MDVEGRLPSPTTAGWSESNATTVVVTRPALTVAWDIVTGKIVESVRRLGGLCRTTLPVGPPSAPETETTVTTRLDVVTSTVGNT